MSGHKLDIVMFQGFPASGKSEILTFVRALDIGGLADMHLGRLLEIDDYKRVDEIFQEDDKLGLAGKERLYSRKQTREDGGFTDERGWEMLGKYMVQKHKELLLANPTLYKDNTVFIECARGGAVGDPLPLRHGYRSTLEQFPIDILRRSAIFYVSVSPETSRERNAAREDQSNPTSQLGHSVPLPVMLRDYGRDDFDTLIIPGNMININGVYIPYVKLDNEKDMTSWVRNKQVTGIDAYTAGQNLHQALKKAFDSLYRGYQCTRSLNSANKKEGFL